MVKRVKLENLGKELSKSLKVLKGLGEENANTVLRGAIIHTWSNIIIGTPVDEGRARGAWQIDTSPTKKVGKKDKRKGSDFVTKEVPVKLFGTKLFLFNNLPYINVLEFGEYPNPPKKGTFNKKKGKFEIRSKGGFSKLAPKGMVRINLRKFKGVLKRLSKAL